MASLTPDIWQQALDARLVHRLWQRAERPGLSRPRQSQALLARHQSMLASTPLAEHLQRHVDAAAQAFPGQLPIVYVQLEPAVADDAQVIQQVSVSQSEDRSMPIVPATLAASPPSPSNLDLTMPQQTIAASIAGTSQPMVIQRSVAPVVPAAPTPTAPPLMPMEHSAPLSPLTLPVLDDGYTPRSDVTLSTLGTQLPSGQTAPIGPIAARATDSASILKQLQFVRSSPVSNSVNSSSAPMAPVPSIALPIVHSAFNDRGSSADRLIVRWSPRPTPNAIDTSDVPVVHEQVTRDSATQASSPLTPTPLPLAAMAAPAPQPATGHFATSELQTAAARHSVVNASKSTTTAPAADTAATKRPTQNEIDIDRIVDRVHRKFIQQLAVEGERRRRR